MDAKLNEIKHKSIVDLIVEELEDHIVNGSLKPGERIIETTLSQKFNVSRASVREALRVLETQGFLVSVPRKGVSVSEVTAQEAEEIFIIRADLESLATYFAIKKQDHTVLEELKAINAQMKNAASRKNKRAYAELNNEFHEIFYNACGNRLLAHMVHTFIKQTMRYRVELFDTDDRLKYSMKSHDSLIKFFERNEPEKARKFRKETLLENAKILVGKIEKNLKRAKNK